MYNNNIFHQITCISSHFRWLHVMAWLPTSDLIYITRHTMHIQRNIETGLHNPRSMEKQKVLHILTVFVALVNQHENHMCCIVLCGLSGSTIFSLYISKTAQFKKKKKVIAHKMCFWYSLQLLLKHSSF